MDRGEIDIDLSALTRQPHTYDVESPPLPPSLPAMNTATESALQHAGLRHRQSYPRNAIIDESVMTHQVPKKIGENDNTDDGIHINNIYSENNAMLSALTITNSILPRIWLGVILSTAWSAVFTTMYMNNKIRFTPYILNPLIIGLLGVVLGLLLGFRANTAYERYMEARKLWSTMRSANRYISTIVWMYVDRDSEISKNRSLCFLNTLLALSVATKHYLRGEHGSLFEDIQPLVGHLPAGAISDQVNLPREISIHLTNYLKTSYDRRNI